MDKRGTYVIAGIIIFAVAGYAFISFQKSSLLDTLPATYDANSRASTTAWENSPAEIVVTQKTVVTAKHAYAKGEHIIAGEVPLPTACDILDSSAIVSADKKQVLVQLASKIVTGDKCTSNITPARFKVTAKANNDAVITATYNGQAVTLNLIEAALGENLDNFELYIKG